MLFRSKLSLYVNFESCKTCILFSPAIDFYFRLLTERTCIWLDGAPKVLYIFLETTYNDPDLTLKWVISYSFKIFWHFSCKCNNCFNSFMTEAFDLQSKPMDCFLYDMDLHHERVSRALTFQKIFDSLKALKNWWKILFISS